MEEIDLPQLHTIDLQAAKRIRSAMRIQGLQEIVLLMLIAGTTLEELDQVIHKNMEAWLKYRGGDFKSNWKAMPPPNLLHHLKDHLRGRSKEPPPRPPYTK